MQLIFWKPSKPYRRPPKIICSGGRLGKFFHRTHVFPNYFGPSATYPCRQVPDNDNIIDLLAAMPTGDAWDDGELWFVYQYVRGSKLLRLPEAYRPLLFKSAS